MNVWWPDTAVEYVGLVSYAVLAGAFVYWLAGVDTNAFIARLFRETSSRPISEYVHCEDPTRCRRDVCETCANGRMAYVASGGDAGRWPLLMEETRARWRREAQHARGSSAPTVAGQAHCPQVGEADLREVVPQR